MGLENRKKLSKSVSGYSKKKVAKTAEVGRDKKIIFFSWIPEVVHHLTECLRLIPQQELVYLVLITEHMRIQFYTILRPVSWRGTDVKMVPSVYLSNK